jgi:hypothetical protein
MYQEYCMSLQYRRDSKGAIQYMLHQNFSDSCGPTSVAMTESYYKMGWLRADIEAREEQMAKKFPGGWKPGKGTANMENLADILAAEKVKVYRATFVHPSAVASYLQFYARPGSPVIVHISWNNGGGHFVVCRQIYPDGTAIFLDPWYLLVERRLSQLPQYVAPDKSQGTTSGWLVITHR